MQGWVNISDQDYHAHEALGSTQLKELLNSPLHFKFRKPLEGPHLQLGSNLHAIVANPLLTDLLIVEPKFDLRTTKGRTDKDAFIKGLPAGAISVSEDDYTSLNEMFCAILDHPVCQLIHSEGIAEQAGFHVDENGIQRKIKPDWRKKGIIADLKTTKKYCASPKRFKNECANFMYHLQAAWYFDTANLIEPGSCEHFLWIAIEKESPYAIAVHEINERSLQLGREQYQIALEAYSKSIKKGKFEGYEPIVHSLDLPNYSFFKE